MSRRRKLKKPKPPHQLTQSLFQQVKREKQPLENHLLHQFQHQRQKKLRKRRRRTRSQSQFQYQFNQLLSRRISQERSRMKMMRMMVSQLRYQSPKFQEVKLKSKRKSLTTLLMPIKRESTLSRPRKPRNTNSKPSRMRSPDMKKASKR